MKTTLTVLLLLLLSGCSTIPKRDEMLKSVSGWELPHKPSNGEGVVYVVRPSALGGLVRFNVFLDKHDPNVEMGWTRGNQYIYFFAKPGKHKVWSIAENNAEIEFDVEKDKAIFIEQVTSMGFFMARNNLRLVGDDVTGKYLVKKAGLGKVKLTRLSEEKK